MARPDLRSRLRQFGLTDAEIAAYLAVLSAGTTRIRTVAERADLSRPYAYDLIQTLADHDLVTVRDHVSPIKVEPVPPAAVASAYEDRIDSLEAAFEGFLATAAGPATADEGAPPRSLIRLRDELVDLGLTPKESNVVLVVYARGETRVSEVATAADVSRAFVYRRSDQLAERGFVVVDEESSPKTLAPRDPDELVAQFRETLTAIVSGVEERYDEDRTATDQVEVVSSPQTVVSRIRELLGETRREAFLSVPASVYPDVESTLRETVDRGVLTLLLVGGVEGDAQPERFRGAGSVSM